ncbi:MAG TPA: L,D-transpeptidase family protein [Gaiellaceae bacterium]|nr:L,D-transpeptidase family protein [Gaiellaceae bacterium]
MKRASFAALFVLGLAAAGMLSGAVIADATTSTSTTTTSADTTAQTTTALTTTAQTTTAPTTTTRRAPAVIAPNVRVGGVRVGGLSPAQAVAAVHASFARPLAVVVDRSTFRLDPRRFASAYVKTAVAKARHARAGAAVPLVVAPRGAVVRAWVANLERRVARAPVDAVLSFRDARPWVSGGQPGRSLDGSRLTQRIVLQLVRNSRLPVRVHTKTLAPKVTAASIGPVIVISTEQNRLWLYDGAKLVRVFPVATGQAIYPTPHGLFHIVVKWKNPWWYPPTQDAWAKGLQPVPPGPNNPLGTRWMGLSAPGVGIHGTDEPSSIGYSASHGCIRMQVPDAEWLFDRVVVGTPVDIV